MEKHDRGRHTTTAVQLHPLWLEAVFVVDTPGVKGLEPWDLSLNDLDQAHIEHTLLPMRTNFAIVSTFMSQNVRYCKPLMKGK